ncbi:MAG: hypothetical protein AB7F35_01125 [Acetobacteraceae bacterium]
MTAALFFTTLIAVTGGMLWLADRQKAKAARIDTGLPVFKRR